LTQVFFFREFDGEFEASYSSNFSWQQQDILKHLSKDKTRRLKEAARDMQTSASSLTTSMKNFYCTMTAQKPKEGTTIYWTTYSACESRRMF
jgi:hypothetical protein